MERELQRSVVGESSLQGYLLALQDEHPEWFMRVEDSLDVNRHDITAFVKKLEDAGKEVTVFFENVTNVLGERSEFPLLFNAFATRRLISYQMGLARDDWKMELTHAFARIESEPGKAVRVGRDDAPVKDVVWDQDEIDVRRFPVPMCHEDDVGPYFVMANLMKARSSGTVDVTMMKNLIHAPRRLSFSAHGHHHLRQIFTEYERHDEPAPVALVLGHHPAFFLGSCAMMPWQNDDYATIAGFMDAPLRLTASETWGEELLVPADAEIVIEGHVLPHVREPQNPFGEISGHYQERMEVPVVEVTDVTHRESAVMQSVFPAHPEHWHLGGVPKEGSVYNSIRRVLPNVTAVHLPMSGGGRFNCVIALDKRDRSDPVKAGMIAATEMPNVKEIVVVDSEINAFDEREVRWAVATQVWWEKDLTVIDHLQTFRPWLGEAVAIVDATHPDDVENFPRRNRIPEEALRRVDVSKYL
jgi:2,5-furandicarboxylate decarboxylase 1